MSDSKTFEMTTLPEYDLPPVTEVICALTFKSLDGFTATHMGLLWSKFQSDYPQIEEHPPVASPIEIFDSLPFQGQMQFTNVPPLPREMFISSNGNYVIQVQRDRFIFNWRKLSDSDVYPRYSAIIDRFRGTLDIFERFIESCQLQLSPIQYELTYINQIPRGESWQSIGELGRIFPNINLSFAGLILESVESTNWRISFELPNQTGRLHVTIRTNAVRTSDQVPVVVFELTVRGMSSSETAEARDEWFNTGREWIVKGFTDFTSPEIQAQFRRKQ